METLEKAVQETGIEVDEDALPSHAAPAGDVEEDEVVAEKGKGKGKGKGKATSEDEEEAERERAVEAEQAEVGKSGQSGRVSPEERLAKMKELRMRMNQSTQANRKSLIEDHQKSKTTQRELARLTKQKKLAENLREKIDNEENGVDGERKKNWGWTIEQNQRWLKAQEEIAEKEKEEFDDADTNAHKLYNKNTKQLKPDLVAYNRQKELALGLAPGTIVPVDAKSVEGSSVVTSVNATGSRRKIVQSSKALSAMEDLYRDANTLSYGDNKASDDAIDRVVGKINADTDKRNKAMRKRKKGEDDGGDVTYINDANKVFNRKINRYFDKYTQEIRANFERGTAL
ncbi:hypothetical protein FFLO_03236 [Filobasidium floriforme]|uniref:Pre-mRNA-splicing factor SYF2 n=1 Tax=Filobasidium floriforme TaxID=5210 RepID=A0A8K0NR09_9TREE|nr:hypothetical protein FFLO_03236 [Filobasidium floriforme]